MSNDNFAKEFVSKLDGKISDEELRLILQELEIFIGDFDIKRRTTDVAEYVAFLPECYKIYFVSKKIEGLSIDSLKTYDFALRRFFEYVNKKLTDITTNDIRLYLYEFQRVKQCKDIYLDSIRVIIHGFMEWCVQEHYLIENPCKPIGRIKFEYKPREPLNNVEMEILRYECDTWRDRAIVEILYSTGCRVSELSRLDKTDVNFDTKEVHLFGKGKKHRISYLNARAEVTLLKYLEERTDDNPALFVRKRKPYTRLTKPGIEDIVRQLGYKCNFGKRIYPHLIRHTTATDALNRGMNVVELQHLLGHEKLDTTMIYAKISQEHIKYSHSRYVV